MGLWKSVDLHSVFTVFEIVIVCDRTVNFVYDLILHELSLLCLFYIFENFTIVQTSIIYLGKHFFCCHLLYLLVSLMFC